MCSSQQNPGLWKACCLSYQLEKLHRHAAINDNFNYVKDYLEISIWVLFEESNDVSHYNDYLTNSFKELLKQKILFCWKL